MFLKMKVYPDGKPDKLKGRLVAGGNQQVAGGKTDAMCFRKESYKRKLLSNICFFNSLIDTIYSQCIIEMNVRTFLLTYVFMTTR
jgi:hypothetical protein